MKLLKKYFSTQVTNSDSYLFIPSYNQPRLIIPLTNKKIYKKGFAIHNTASKKNSFIKILLMYSYQMQKRFNKNIRFPREGLLKLISFVKTNLIIKENIYFSIYVGTKGNLNQKLTWQLFNSKLNTLGYLKVSDNPDSKKFIENEYDIIQYLNSVKPNTFEYPVKANLLNFEEVNLLFLSDCAKNTGKVMLKLDDKILNSLIEFTHIRLTSISKNKYLNNFEERFHLLQPQLINKNLICYVEKVLNDLIKIDFNLILVHNDFVKYNLRTRGNKLVVFDWEFAQKEGLPFIDLFHFLFQGYYQIKKISADKIIKNIFNKNEPFITKYASALKIHTQYIKSFFVIYLVEKLLFDAHNRTDFDIEDNHFLKALIIISQIKQ